MSIIDMGSSVVVCLASHGQRLQYAHTAIESIANGIVKPGRIILVVDDGDELTPELQELGNRGLEIWRGESRFGPHNKWYLFAQKCPDFDGVFVTADDDVIYPPEWLSDLLQYACPQLVVAHRAHRMLVNDGELGSYLEWTTAPLSSGNKFFVTGVSGVAYPAAVLNEAARYGEEFLVECPRNDDVWLNRAIVRSRVPIVLLGASKWHNMIPGSQDVSLWSDNRAQNDMQIAATFSESDIRELQSGMLKDILIDNDTEKRLRSEVSNLKIVESNLKAVVANREEQILGIVNEARELDGYAKSLEDVVHERDATISKLSQELEAIKKFKGISACAIRAVVHSVGHRKVIDIVNLHADIKCEKSKIRSIWSDNLPFFLLLLANWLFIYILNRWTPMLADDFSLSRVPNPLARVIADYFAWNGRIVGQFIGIQFLQFNGAIFDLLNTTIYVIFILLLLFLSSRRGQALSIPKLLLANFLCWIFIPNVGQSFLWVMGAGNYLWVMTFILLSLVPLRLFEDNPQWRGFHPTVLNFMLFAIVGFLAGLGNENTSIAPLLIYGVWIAWQKFFREGSQGVPAPIIALIAGVAIGYAILLAAPGAAVRSQHFPASTLLGRIMANGQTISDGLLANNYHWLVAIFAILFGIHYYGGARTETAVKALVVFVVGVTTVYMLVATPIGLAGPGRAWFGPTVLMILGILTLTSGERSMLASISLALVITTGAVFLAQAWSGTAEIRTANQRIAQRAAWVAAQSEAGNLYPIVPEINANSQFWGGFGLSDIARDDSANWINDHWAAVHGVNRVNSVSQGLWERFYRDGDPIWMRIQNLNEYLTQIRNDHVFAIISGYGNQPISRIFRDDPALQILDFPETSRWVYTAVIEPGGHLVFQSTDNLVNYSVQLNGQAAEVTTRSDPDLRFPSSSSIRAQGTEVSRNMEGLNIVIFSEDGRLLDTVAFNVTDNGFLPYRLDIGRFLRRTTQLVPPGAVVN